MYKVYAITDVGKERNCNQDGFLIDGMHCEDVDHREIYYETDSDYIHLAVCDGVGSTEFASLAVKRAQEYICNHLFISNEHDIEKMIIDMNEYVFSTLRNEHKQDGACTIAGIVMIKNKAFIYNVGDSSVYSINNGYLEKHTTDDTGSTQYGEELYQDDEMRIKPPLIQSIGTNQLIDFVHVKSEEDDVAFMLCTDGITDMLSIDEMEMIIESSDSIRDVAQMFVNEANRHGGFDNSTMIILVNEEN